MKLGRVLVRATARYHRRRAVTDWFWNWCAKKWRHKPRLSTKVRYAVVRDVPVFATYRPRHSYVGWHEHICYEGCVHLEEQARALVLRLQNRRTNST